MLIFALITFLIICLIIIIVILLIKPKTMTTLEPSETSKTSENPETEISKLLFNSPKVLFAPFSNDTKNNILATQKELLTELDYINLITNLRKKDKKTPKGQKVNNPYKIKYCVYNLLSVSIVKALNNAIKYGVYVQVLIDSAQTDPCRNYNIGLTAFAKKNDKSPICWKPLNKNSSLCITQNSNNKCKYTFLCDSQLKVEPTNECILKSFNPNAWISGGSLGRNSNLPINDQLSPKNIADLINNSKSPNQFWITNEYEKPNMIPIYSISSNGNLGIMHVKMRLFEWIDNNSFIKLIFRNNF